MAGANIMASPVCAPIYNAFLETHRRGPPAPGVPARAIAREPTMSAPTTIEEFVGVMSRSGLVEEAAVRSYVDALRAAGNLPGQPRDLARAMIRDGLLTRFQSQQVLQGKTRGFLIAGKYKLL